MPGSSRWIEAGFGGRHGISTEGNSTVNIEPAYRPFSRVPGLLRDVAAAMLAALACGTAQAAYPEKPVKLLVPFAAGGSTDIAARIVGRHLSDKLRQPFIVENRLGAGGTITFEAVARAAPDGYTLGVFAGSFSTAPSLYRKLRFDPIADFAPVIHLADLSFVLMVHPSLQANSVSELIALAKQKPLTYGSGGNGNTMHLAGELLSASAGVRMQHVPYKGGAPALNDLLGGQLSLVIAPLDMSLRHIHAGTLRALAVASRSRSALAPALPTVGESGVPGYEISSWVGVLAPAGTPPAIVSLLNAEIGKALQQPDVKEQFLKQALPPIGGTPEQFGELLKAEHQKWARLFKEAGIQPLD